MKIERKRPRRSDSLTVRLTESERLGAEAAARAEDVSVSEIVRAGIREMTRRALATTDED